VESDQLSLCDCREPDAGAAFASSLCVHVVAPEVTSVAVDPVAHLAGFPRLRSVLIVVATLHVSDGEEAIGHVAVEQLLLLVVVAAVVSGCSTRCHIYEC